MADRGTNRARVSAGGLQAAVVGVLLFLAAASSGSASPQPPAPAQSTNPAQSTKPAQTPATASASGPVVPAGESAVAALEQVLVEVIARAEPSVVGIARVRKERPGEGLGLELRPDSFGAHRVVPLIPPRPTDPEFIPHDYATGVIVDPRGLVLTARHVLADESEYYITTRDRRVFRATVLGADPRSDLAVLAPEKGSLAAEGAASFTPIAFGDAASLKKGQIVVSVGNPFAIGRDGRPSATWGIVSNLHRKAVSPPDEASPSDRTTLHQFGTLIQTDARLQLGTSGAPLLNRRGEMIGLATSMASAPGYESAAGYAIPVDATFRRVLDALKQGREVEYGILGIRLRNLEPDERLRGLEGACVETVVPGLPAGRAGLKQEDLVTRINGAPILDSDGLVVEMSRWPLESPVRLSVRRGTRSFDVEIQPTKYLVQGKKVVTSPLPGWRGLRVDYVTGVRPLDGIPKHVHDAVAVADVEKASSAWESGLRPGMFISHVASTAVRTPKDFRQAVARLGDRVQLRVLGEDEQQKPRSIDVVP